MCCIQQSAQQHASLEKYYISEQKIGGGNDCAYLCGLDTTHAPLSLTFLQTSYRPQGIPSSLKNKTKIELGYL